MEELGQALREGRDVLCERRRPGKPRSYGVDELGQALYEGRDVLWERRHPGKPGFHGIDELREVLHEGRDVPDPLRAYALIARLNRLASANMSTFVKTYVASLFTAVVASSASLSIAGSS